jgi:3-methyl-2-oxobutanoate hydroxymethyltransferase
VIKGNRTTLSATLRDMLLFVGYVRNGIGADSNIDLVGDMPAGTYSNVKDAIDNSKRMIDAGATSVKIECPQGALPQITDVVRSIKDAGISIMGHIGFLPQTSARPKTNGSTPEETQRLVADALELEKAGIGSIVLELIYAETAKQITEKLSIPTIAFAGSGPFCSGQGMNIYDILHASSLSGNPSICWIPKTRAPGAGAIKEWLLNVNEGTYPAIGEYHSLENLYLKK